MNTIKSQCQITSQASWDSTRWNHVCDSVKEAAPCGSRRIRNHVQDKSEVIPPDGPTAMGADAGLLCICALYVSTLLINPETSLESMDCADMPSPTRVPQVCAQCMRRMAGKHPTPFTAAHLHRRSDSSEKHQKPVTSMCAKQGHTQTMFPAHALHEGNPLQQPPCTWSALWAPEVGSETGWQGAKPDYILTDIPLQQIVRRHGIPQLNSSFGKMLAIPRCVLGVALLSTAASESLA